MVFCMTRAICISTSKLLAEAWRKWTDSQRPWRAPQRTFSFQNKDLQATAECGVAFHHAGLDQGDRSLVENLYLEGQISVICCTSTLAVGVNLPAHLVVLKNTVGYGDKGPQEYVDMEVMQMLGRAGRPQFNDSGVAVIMTAQNKKQKYENMDSGKEMVESSLHENLVEHMNAEIGLSTITSMETAKSWLKSTFLYIRLQKNPLYYKLEGQTPQKNKNSEQRLDDICEREVDILQVEGMVTENYGRLSLTKFGEAMAKYYIKLGTMRHIIKMRPKSTLPEIVGNHMSYHDTRLLIIAAHNLIGGRRIQGSEVTHGRKRTLQRA
jgi:ATP-dependent DNA helicase HFM1/MER3